MKQQTTINEEPVKHFYRRRINIDYKGGSKHKN